MNLPPNVQHRYGNTYRYRWHITGIDGQGERRSEQFHADTIEEVWEQWNQINDLIRRSRGFVDTGLTVSAWREKWLSTRRRTKEPKTVLGDEYRTRYFTDAYGTVRLRDVQPHMVDDFYADMLDVGLSAQTVKGFHSTIRKMFNDAIRKNVIAINPCLGADVPTVRTQARTVWTPNLVARFLTETRHHPMYPLWYVALHTGMRREEYAWLRWRDIDRDTIRITRRVVVTNTPIVLPATKTGAGRAVTLDHASVLELRRLRSEQAEALLASGIRQTPDTTIAVTRDGGPLNPDYVSSTWKQTVERVGIEPYMPMRNTRHTWATIALAGGEEPLVVSERLGHASIGITLTMYAQVTARSQHRAASAMSNAIGEISEWGGTT